MKKRRLSTLLMLCMALALLLTACSNTAQNGKPTVGPSNEPTEPSSTSEVNSSPPTERVGTPDLMPDGVDSRPSPANTPAASDTPPMATDTPPAATNTPPVVTDALPVVTDEPPMATDAPPMVTYEPTASSARLGETPDAGREYLDKLIFLGDSTTYGIGYYYQHGYAADLVPPSQVWTPVSGTLTLSYYATATIVYPETGEELFIRDAVARAKPEYLVITLGVNGISFMDEAWFVRDYTSLVETVKSASPETRIILNSIYPVAASYPHQADINNNKIRAANVWIEQIAVDTGVRFLYSYESVVGADGNLPESSSNGDGLHLTGQSFAKVMAYIRTHKYR